MFDVHFLVFGRLGRAHQKCWVSYLYPTYEN
jgi:hypothetical protein